MQLGAGATAPDSLVSPEGAAAGAGAERAGAAAPARRAPAPETSRLYAADWQRFVAWCAAADCAALPALPAPVAAFLTESAAQCGAGALGRRAAAIAQRHRQAGFSPVPTSDPAVRTILSTTRHAATPRRPPKPRPAQLLRMAAACPGDLAGLRDRALLLLAAAGLGRAALVGLDAERISFTARGVKLAVPQPGAASDLRQTISVPRGATMASCPVQALRDWLRSSDTRFGPVFRKIDRWGTIEQRRLGTDALRRILARRTRRRRRRTSTAAA
jgi:site-specific recombinase XerC